MPMESGLVSAAYDSPRAATGGSCTPASDFATFARQRLARVMGRRSLVASVSMALITMMVHALSITPEGTNHVAGSTSQERGFDPGSHNEDEQRLVDDEGQRQRERQTFLVL